MAAPTPEEIIKLVRLESIFMPASRAKRAEKLQRDNPDSLHDLSSNFGKFAHYTSAEAALKIINTKRLWMRNTTCMADFREVEHGFDAFVSFFSNEANRSQFLAAFDQIAEGVAKAAIDLFDQWWPKIRYAIFVASVSEHSPSEDSLGRLSMWRAFGAGQPRVAMVFSVPWYSGAAEAMGLMFSPVLYHGRDGVFSMMRQIMDRVAQEEEFLKQLPAEEIRNWIFQMLLSGVACTKHEGFSEEREWRGVLTPIFGYAGLVEASTEVIRGVPQIVHKIPFDEAKSPLLADLDLSKILDHVIIGPTDYPVAVAGAFVDALKACGVVDSEKRVVVSDIPIRS